jgi:hypothetical protein
VVAGQAFVALDQAVNWQVSERHRVTYEERTQNTPKVVAPSLAGADEGPVDEGEGVGGVLGADGHPVMRTGIL